MSDFGARLHRLRVERELSQAELGEALGVTQTMISAMERGEKRPSVELLVKTARYFEVTVDELAMSVVWTSHG